MTCHKLHLVGLLALTVVSSAACVVAQPTNSAGTGSECVATTIEDLARNPGQYDRRRICVAGFLGRMVPYGETSAELFATRQQAESIQADVYLELGVPLDLRRQEILSRYSGQPARVEGIFEFDARCWPNAGQTEPEYDCFPPRPMRVTRPELQFANGTSVR